MFSSWKVSCVAIGSALALSATIAVAAPSTHYLPAHNGLVTSAAIPGIPNPRPTAAIPGIPNPRPTA